MGKATKAKEADIAAALNDIRNGSTLRGACAKWNVPYATLHDRMVKTADVRISAAESARVSRRFTKEQEDLIAQWALAQKLLGFPLSQAEITAFAVRVYAASGNTHPLGQYWIKRFVKKYPAIKGPPRKKRNKGGPDAEGQDESMADVEAEAGAEVEGDVSSPEDYPEDFPEGGEGSQDGGQQPCAPDSSSSTPTYTNAVFNLLNPEPPTQPTETYRRKS